MPNYQELESKIESIIDDLKGLCNVNGLSNQAAEEVIITSVFLYKFLNDKFMYNIKAFAKEMGMDYKDVLKNKDDSLDGFYDSYPQDVAFSYEETIEYLINKVSSDDFYKQFDDALERISNNPKNDAFRVETAEGPKEPLFIRITEYVESGNRNNFATNIFGIISQERFDFEAAFNNNFDFYSRIFEYLIKDYNVASGVYAEYFTPQIVSSIISKILVSMSPIEDKIYDIYDGAAGSGSLVLHLANELGDGSFGKKARVFTQDVSGKSSRFLRINMMLNGLSSSLDNIIKGDTILTPAHYNRPHDPSSGVRRFSYITMNPPFKVDFSSTRDAIEKKWENTDRFFAGIPKIPNKKKESMAIYLCFIQHVLWSLKDDGKAAIVVPTGFLTAQSSIEKTIRQKLIDSKWLKGVVSMPSNIFANTGTNVSVIFIDKANESEDVILIDASNFGTKVKDGKNQKTVLSDEEVNKIEDTFINREVVEDFSVIATYDEMKEKNYSFSAGQYFEIKIEYVDITTEEFNKKMKLHTENLSKSFETSISLEREILDSLNGVIYE